ncbi:MAG: NADH-quinone oxidoreductase subunit I [Dehalococcoidales bacterium]|nr:NADH-quinone oxidoreductase subunit I [Dehalococcoidales bacterium]
MRVLGLGIVKGMWTTLRHFASRPITMQYPEENRPVAARSRGVPVFDSSKCLMCSYCARACPHGNIMMEVSFNADGARVLERYDLDLGYCMFCGLCAEACPTGALTFGNQYEHAVYSRKENILTKERFAAERQRLLASPEPRGRKGMKIA